MNIVVKFFALISLVALGCKNDRVNRAPKCITDLIHQVKDESGSNPASKIYRYLYKGKTVYYILPECCDASSKLVDEDCNVLSFPDVVLRWSGLAAH